jgi:glutathione S-transferase
MLKIWGRKNSVNVQKVLLCCEELALPYERIDAGLAFGVVNTPEYRKLNPNAMIPAIVDDGFVLWESNVIVRYLAEKHGTGTLCPSDRQRRAEADQWMEWQQTVFWPAIRPLFMGLIRTPVEQRDPKALEASRRDTAQALTILDAHLASWQWLAGDAFTMADIPMGCTIWRWMALPIERPEFTNVRRWFDALGTRPAYRNVVMQPLT